MISTTNYMETATNYGKSNKSSNTNTRTGIKLIHSILNTHCPECILTPSLVLKKGEKYSTRINDVRDCRWMTLTSPCLLLLLGPTAFPERREYCRLLKRDRFPSVNRESYPIVNDTLADYNAVNSTICNKSFLK
jgi:hypothetical protein